MRVFALHRQSAPVMATSGSKTCVLQAKQVLHCAQHALVILESVRYPCSPELTAGCALPQRPEAAAAQVATPAPPPLPSLHSCLAAVGVGLLDASPASPPPTAATLLSTTPAGRLHQHQRMSFGSMHGCKAESGQHQHVSARSLQENADRGRTCVPLCCLRGRGAIAGTAQLLTTASTRHGHRLQRRRASWCLENELKARQMLQAAPQAGAAMPHAR